MNERERILDLVKKGIISTDEALSLLENSAKDKSTAEQQATTKVTPEKSTEEQTTDKKDEQEQDELANEVEELQTKTQQINEQLTQNARDLKTQQEHLQVLNTMEDLETLSTEKVQDRDETKEKIGQLESKQANLSDEKRHLQHELAAKRHEQRDKIKNHLADKLNLGDEWRDNATDTLNQVGEKVGEAGSQFGQFIKGTAQTIMDNVDWKDVNIKVPGIATTKFEHEFNYADTTASILDVKVANGDVKLKTWDGTDIKVSVSGKLYGKMADVSPLENFLQRSEIAIDADVFTFKVPNKRIQANLTFYLPKRTYDHTTIKLLNGDVDLTDFEGEDLYIKSTNGQMTFTGVNASMLEVEGVNGNIKVNGGRLIDALLNTINGEVKFMSNAESVELTTVNGEVKATVNETTLTKLVASSVNGNVKIALPEDLAVTGQTKSRFGAIKSRLSEVTVTNERHNTGNSVYDFERDLSTPPAKLTLSTTSGNILLKNTKA
ncbi:daptomycin-sensing surface protein LiaX [Loigolactobacillus backii]|uniref:Uncharacterized protein n=1 Tax=Loigolactobacillus backii TaxID=375175 RepID=A0A192H4Z7_9LACO|nr:daptomycin-sensing surface protein LiaX [Loigolactobacillus backii]ANK59981.1 hypothetical protein AYR52_06730 [Loigolactobacillus backii]ANK63318.1 hypothetical protein AYR53_11390 [Loigolactobacillus backii]ANK64915.1 hypothetical protein AYR54_06410 [Loigolactobacillus backii]ANK66638.1 hypothetical protein AYR55_02350 [Loigolactobacillus backii]ANK69677.1 hypothetical protein AYR56_05615 [Loigolactobacillus backii]